MSFFIRAASPGRYCAAHLAASRPVARAALSPVDTGRDVELDDLGRAPEGAGSGALPRSEG